MHYRMFSCISGTTYHRPGATPSHTVTSKMSSDTAMCSPNSFLREMHFIFFRHDLVKGVPNGSVLVKNGKKIVLVHL